MVLLRGLDSVESWPEIASTETVVGCREVVVVVTFSGACYAGVVDADGVMATRVAVCSHVACVEERACVSVATSAAAASISAVSKTIKGSLPPNSKTTFLICFPAAAAKLIPAGSLPVKVAAFTRSSLIKSFSVMVDANFVFKFLYASSAFTKS